MMDCDSERIWKIVESHRLNVPKRKRQPGSSLSLFDRLYDCYVECNSDKSADKRFRSAVNLLQRIDPEHARVSLVVSLYSDTKGYSLMLCPSEDGVGEEIFIPYEDNEIFGYLDNQEIPPVLLEVIEKTQHCHMYSGCVVCEVRDYRNPLSPDSYDKHLLLLRPTTETILATVNDIAHETNCSQEERLFLESRILLATQPPICLDPSTDVVCVTNRLQYNQRKFHTHSMRRYLRRRSQACRARMYMVSEREAPPRLRLHDFILQHKAAPLRRENSDSWKKPRLDLTHPCNPEEIARDILRLAKVPTERDQVLPEQPHPPPPPPDKTQLVTQRLPPTAEKFVNALLDTGISGGDAPRSIKVEPSVQQTVVQMTTQAVVNPSPQPHPSQTAVQMTTQAVVNPSLQPHPSQTVVQMTTQAVVNPSPQPHPSQTAVQMTTQAVVNPSLQPHPSQTAVQMTTQAVVNPSLQPHPSQTISRVSQQNIRISSPAVLEMFRGGVRRVHNRPIAPRPGLPITTQGSSTMVQLLAAQKAIAQQHHKQQQPSVLNVAVAATQTGTSVGGVVVKPVGQQFVRGTVVGTKVPVSQPMGTQAGIVIVSRPAGPKGQQAMPGFVSVQQVPSLVRRTDGGAPTPPHLKAPPTSLTRSTTSPPTLPKLQQVTPPGIQSASQGPVKASMPKLTPLDPLKQTSPSRVSTSPAMPQLHKITPKASPGSSPGGQTSQLAAALSAKQMPPLKVSPLVAAKKPQTQR